MNKTQPDGAENSIPRVTVSGARYGASSTAYFTIEKVEMEGDVMTLSIGASGCNGETWQVELVDSERTLRSYPAQRSLKILFTNDELCQAYFVKEYKFNISELQLGKRGQVYLNLMDYKDQLLYEY